MTTEVKIYLQVILISAIFCVKSISTLENPDYLLHHFNHASISGEYFNLSL